MKERRGTKRGGETKRGGGEANIKISGLQGSERSKVWRKRSGLSIFPRTGKIFSPSFAHLPLPLSLSLPPPLLSFFLWTGSTGLSSISAIPSPYSKVSQSATTFARLSFFPPSLLSSPRPSSLVSSSPLSPFPSRPTCIGKYESFVPSALSGTCICHGHTQAKPVRTVGNAHACACVRACDCLLAGGDKDRSWRVGARDEKNRSERAREGEGGREREAEETEASLHQGVEDGQNGRVVRPNDDIPRLRSKFSQLTSRITRPRETRIFRKATRFPLILPLLLPLPLPLLRHAQDDG